MEAVHRLKTDRATGHRCASGPSPALYEMATRIVLVVPSGTTMRSRPWLTRMRSVRVPDGESTRTMTLDR